MNQVNPAANSTALLRKLADDIAERSDGIPGAINVMCGGIIHHGQEWWDALVKKDWRGAEIWDQYKQHQHSLKSMMETMKS